jgi:nucleoside-diphosphate-sugar epimerase
MILESKRVLLTGASGFIGTNLVDFLASCGAEVVNADIQKPLKLVQAPQWRCCDVADPGAIRELVAEFEPNFVVHLAAKTDTDSASVGNYAINHVGTRNVVSALDLSKCASRFVFVSTQFVLGPGVVFESDTQYAPHTAYGQSKVRAEVELRERPPSMAWVIVRPTNVWGPWHERYRREFWRVLRDGYYVHPSSPDPIRSYGYVGSVCLQILGVLLAEQSRVHEKTLYVGDMPVPLSEWVDAFSMALRGKRARRVPGVVMSSVARLGDLLQKVGLPTLINGSRYRSMTQEYTTPMDRTTEALGGLPSVDLARGVAESVAWLSTGRSADVATWLNERSRTEYLTEGTRG